jgi:HAT1-interacting factor 1
LLTCLARYPLAINDARASLKYKTELYPEESEIRAEAHFKLSLALEFASVTTSDEDDKDGPKTVDQEMRDEAAAELEKAISSTKLKLQNEEVNLATLHAPEENELSRKKIAEVKEIIADMEQRVSRSTLLPCLLCVPTCVYDANVSLIPVG